ncbi:zinc finger CCCH domain-containing protein 56-like isoform X2 [Salvia hispanica]|uniref:zinc finger CCCH domain-containing protein 56-like isoform X2 n=1 Tax=Salvia hispanica TaxID=49212 RepID=UPI00200974B2|nr:zinc finger CCCH domain-containing protein 56-like isoform X2 [Salvia hispanica]
MPQLLAMTASMHYAPSGLPARRLIGGARRIFYRRGKVVFLLQNSVHICGVSSILWNKPNDKQGSGSHVADEVSERSFQFDVESDPPNKRAKKAIEKVLYKTRPCFQFRAGSCPFAENCEFAHSMEELRELPHSHKEEPMRLSEQPREVSQIPVVGLNEVKHRRSPRQHCKGFLSTAGCQNGEKCLLIHNEHYMERKSAAICVLPGSGGGFKSNGSTSNWKARLCTKWDLTGMCGYGKNCIFAHGLAELQQYRGRQVKKKDSGSSALGANQVASVPAKASVGHVPYSYHIGAPPRRLSGEVPRTGEVAIRNWKGPDKISKIYGDWIDDLK